MDDYNDELHDLRQQMVRMLAAIMAEPSYKRRKAMRVDLDAITDRIRELNPGAAPWPAEPVEIIST